MDFAPSSSTICYPNDQTTNEGLDRLLTSTLGTKPPTKQRAQLTQNSISYIPNHAYEYLRSLAAWANNLTQFCNRLSHGIHVGFKAAPWSPFSYKKMMWKYEIYQLLLLV